MDETTEALSPRIINRSCVFYLPNEYKIPSLDNYFQSDHYPISYQSLRKNFGYENILQNNHNAEKYGQDKLDAIYDLLSKIKVEVPYLFQRENKNDSNVYRYND